MIKTTKRISIEQIAEKFDLKLVGDNGTQIIEGVATLEHAKSKELSFFTNKKYKDDFLKSKAAAIIIYENDIESCPGTALVAENPYLAYAKIAHFLTNRDNFDNNTHPSAIIHSEAKVSDSCDIGAHVVIAEGVVIGRNTRIGAGCVISANAQIGENCLFYPNVTVYHDVKIKNDVIIHSGTVIGSDGFGIANDQGKWVKVPQLGSVIIGSDVEMGACCTIDRGAIEDTIISDGVKLDNQVHIAHNDFIGKNTAIAAQVGISGSTEIGINCAIGGQVGIVGHAKIADNVQITGGSRVLSSLPESGAYTSGTPLQETSLWYKNHIRFKQLDSMYRQFKKISKAMLPGE